MIKHDDPRVLLVNIHSPQIDPPFGAPLLAEVSRGSRGRGAWSREPKNGERSVIKADMKGSGARQMKAWNLKVTIYFQAGYILSMY